MRVVIGILALAAALGGCRGPDTGAHRTESGAPATAARAPAVPDASGSTSVAVTADPDIVLTSDCIRQTLINRHAAVDVADAGQFKRLHGDEKGAARLEREAEALDVHAP